MPLSSNIDTTTKNAKKKNNPTCHDCKGNHQTGSFSCKYSKMVFKILESSDIEEDSRNISETISWAKVMKNPLADNFTIILNKKFESENSNDLLMNNKYTVKQETDYPTTRS